MPTYREVLLLSLVLGMGVSQYLQHDTFRLQRQRMDMLSERLDLHWESLKEQDRTMQRSLDMHRKAQEALATLIQQRQQDAQTLEEHTRGLLAGDVAMELSLQLHQRHQEAIDKLAAQCRKPPW